MQTVPSELVGLGGTFGKGGKNRIFALLSLDGLRGAFGRGLYVWKRTSS
jgi:hypothetical protein